jgi:hypothetical protein
MVLSQVFKDWVEVFNFLDNVSYLLGVRSKLPLLLLTIPLMVILLVRSLSTDVDQKENKKEVMQDTAAKRKARRDVEIQPPEGFVKMNVSPSDPEVFEEKVGILDNWTIPLTVEEFRRDVSRLENENVKFLLKNGRDIPTISMYLDEDKKTNVLYFKKILKKGKKKKDLDE